MRKSRVLIIVFVFLLTLSIVTTAMATANRAADQKNLSQDTKPPDDGDGPKPEDKAPGDETSGSPASESPLLKSIPPGVSVEAYAISKIDPLLRDAAQTGSSEEYLVMVLASPEVDLSQYGQVLSKGDKDPLGVAHVMMRLPARLLIKVASRADVATIESMGPKPAPEPPDPEAPGAGPTGQPVSTENLDQAKLEAARQGHALAQAIAIAPEQIIDPPAEPEAWFENATQGVYATWNLNISGQGDSADPIKYAVIDTGVDFCNAALLGRWAVQNSNVNPSYNGWPIAYDDRSASTFISYYPAQGPNYGGNWGWYVNANRMVNEGPFADALYGRIYTTPGTSLSGNYRYGYHPDRMWHDLRIYGASPVILVGDPNVPGLYDTVYIDGNWNGVFGESGDAVVTQTRPAGCIDWTGPIGGPDNVADDSYGLLYWISDGANPLPGVNWLYGGGTPVPPQGSVLLFMINNIFESGGDHGTMCASSAAGYDWGVFNDYHNQLAPFYPPALPIVAGPGSGGWLDAGVDIIPMGNFYAGGSAFNNYLFTVFGYDNIYGNSDNPRIVSLSYGSGSEDADAWDFQSEYISALNLWLEMYGSFSPAYVKSAGNGGHGYGTVNTPGPTTAIAVGASTQYGPYNVWGYWEGVSQVWQAVFQDVQPWSDRGPSAMNWLTPHVVTNGAWGSGGIPANESTYVGGMGGDGSTAWVMWGGTSRSAPVAAGMLALVYDAYYQKHGVYPDWRLGRQLLMNGTIDIKYDEFVGGAGQADAYRSAITARGDYGVTVDPAYYIAGAFPPSGNQRFESFAMGLLPGQSSTQQFTVRNDSATPINVNLRDERLEEIATYTATITTIPGDPTSNYSYGAPNYLLNLSQYVVDNPGADLMIVRTAQPAGNFDTLPPTPPSANNRFRAVVYNVYDDGDGIWWLDLNANGRVEISQTVGLANHELDVDDQYIRFTYSYNVSNMQELDVHDPYPRMGSGGIWLGLARASGTTPTTIQIEIKFYEQTDWDAVSLSTTNLTVPAGGTATFNATVNTSSRGATLFTENFDAATPPALPAGWAKVDVSGTTGDWFTKVGTRYPSGQPAHSPPNLAYFNSYDASSGYSTRLYRTSGIDASGLSGLEMSFWMYHDTGYSSNADRVQVQASTDGGSNWVNAGSAVNRYDGSNSWKKHTIDLSAFTGFSDVRIAFLGISAYGNDCHIDDIEVYEVFTYNPGVYTGRIVVNDPGDPTGGYDPHDVIIPVEMQVFALVQGDPVLGGTPRAVTPYDNGYVYGAYSYGGRGEVGDWRMFGLVVTQTTPGSVLLVDNVWEDYPTDIDTLILDQVPNWDMTSAGGPPGLYPFNWFGPYTLDDLGAGSVRFGVRPNWKYYTNIAGATGTQTHEFVTAPAYNGLRMLLNHAVLYGGNQIGVPFTTHVAVAALTPNPVDLGTGYDCISDTAEVQFKSGMNLDGLFVGGVYGWYQPVMLFDQPIYQDNPNNSMTASWIYPIGLNGSYRLEVKTYNARNAPDIDLFVVKDNDSSGTWTAGDVVVGSSATSSSDEHVLLKNLPNGNYLVAVHGYQVTGNPGLFDISIEDVHGGAVLGVSGLPSPVTAGQTYVLTIHMDGSLPGPGNWKALILLGPSAANTAIELPVFVHQGNAAKFSQSDFVLRGETTNFTVTLQAAPGAPVLWQVDDPIPAGMEFVSVSGANYNAGDNSVEWAGFLGAGLAPVWGENFESATPRFFPTGWITSVVTYTNLTHPAWYTNVGTHHPTGQPAHSGTKLAYFNSYHASSPKGARLARTTGWDLSGVPQAYVHLWVYHDTGWSSSADKVYVQVCTNSVCNPATLADWITLATINRYDGSTGWKEHIVDLTPVLGQADVRLGLLGKSAYGNDLHVDDISLHVPIAIPGHLIVMTLRAVNPGTVTNVAYVTTPANTCPVPAPPVQVGGAVTNWHKKVVINEQWHDWLEGPFMVTPGDHVSIYDQVYITTTGPVTFTLGQMWSESLEFTGAGASIGDLSIGDHVITWTVQGEAAGVTHTMQADFTVLAGMGFDDLVNEWLVVTDGPQITPRVVEFHIPAYLTKDAPPEANTGQMMTYQVVIHGDGPFRGQGWLTDTLPIGVEFAGGLTYTFGSAWYDATDGAVYWTNAINATAQQQPAPAGGLRRVTLSLQAVPAASNTRAPAAPDGPVNLVLDDGGIESFVGLNGGGFAYQFLWFNRFSPNPADFPFALSQIQVLFGSTGVPAGGPVDLVIYHDPDGNPANGANWLATVPVTVQYADGSSWSVYNLATPIVFNAPGDVFIGAINRFTISGVSPAAFPAGLDSTASQLRSWVAAWVLDPPNPPILPSDDTYALIDSFGLPGNWAIRGSGQTIFVPDTVTITFNVTVTAGGPTWIENEAIFDYHGVVAHTTADTYVPGVDVVVTKTAAPTPVIVGEQFFYTITVSNNGPDTAHNVQVVDILPAGVTLVNYPPYCSLVGQVLTCNPGYLTSGNAIPIGLELTAPGAEGVITNVVDVTSDEFDTNTVNNHFELETQVYMIKVDLAVTKSAEPPSVIVGHQMFYSIWVTNNGPDTATGVQVVDTLPAGVTLISTPAGCNLVGQVLTCAVPDLPSSGSVNIYFQLFAPDVEGVITNEVDATSNEFDTNMANNHFELETLIYFIRFFMPVILNAP